MSCSLSFAPFIADQDYILGQGSSVHHFHKGDVLWRAIVPSLGRVFIGAEFLKTGTASGQRTLGYVECPEGLAHFQAQSRIGGPLGFMEEVGDDFGIHVDPPPPPPKERPEPYVIQGCWQTIRNPCLRTHDHMGPIGTTLSYNNDISGCSWGPAMQGVTLLRITLQDNIGTLGLTPPDINISNCGTDAGYLFWNPMDEIISGSVWDFTPNGCSLDSCYLDEFVNDSTFGPAQFIFTGDPNPDMPDITYAYTFPIPGHQVIIVSPVQGPTFDWITGPCTPGLSTRELISRNAYNTFDGNSCCGHVTLYGGAACRVSGRVYLGMFQTTLTDDGNQAWNAFGIQFGSAALAQDQTDFPHNLFCQLFATTLTGDSGTSCWFAEWVGGATFSATLEAE